MVSHLFSSFCDLSICLQLKTEDPQLLLVRFQLPKAVFYLVLHPFGWFCCAFKLFCNSLAGLAARLESILAARKWFWLPYKIVGQAYGTGAKVHRTVVLAQDMLLFPPTGMLFWSQDCCSGPQDC